MSALLAMAGMFPPAPSQQWDDKLQWLPIPLTYERNGLDFVSTQYIHLTSTEFPIFTFADVEKTKLLLPRVPQRTGQSITYRTSGGIPEEEQERAGVH